MKKIQLLIISLSMILVIGCIIITILYFATDIFKTESNKESFNKYIAQMDLKEFINLEEYSTNLQRMQNESYLSEGEFSINIEAEEETWIDEKFEYSLKADPSNEKASTQIDVIIDGQNELTIDYLSNGDLYGIRFRDIINQYIVLENNNLGEFVSKLGLEPSSVPDKLEIPQEYSGILNSEELEKIFSKYVGMILNEIPEENYAKIEEGYTVKINPQNFSNIMNKVLEEAKQDEEIFNLIKRISDEDYDFDEYQEMLEEITIEEIEEVIEITVYINKEETIKIEIKYGEELGCSIEKRSINIENKEENLNITINKNDDNKYEVLYGFEEDGTKIKINLVYSNNITFDDNMEIDDYDEINHAIINDFSGEQIEGIVTGVIKLLVEKTNIENGIIGTVVNEMMMGETIQGGTQNSIDNVEQQMSNQAAGMFNSRFTYYEGIQRGSSVKQLIGTIQSSNATDLEHQIQYTEEEVETNKTYEISFEQDRQGYINKVIIEEQ